MNLEPFLQLDRIIHEKGRLAILSLMAATPELSFTEIRDTLSMTDGNLTAHIRTLQEAGLVSAPAKAARPRTTRAETRRRSRSCTCRRKRPCALCRRARDRA